MAGIFDIEALKKEHEESSERNRIMNLAYAEAYARFIEEHAKNMRLE